MFRLTAVCIFFSQAITAQINRGSLPVSAAFSVLPYADSIEVRTSKIAGNIYLLNCINGFGGGNVAASAGEDGILLTDDMYARMGEKLQAALTGLSSKSVRILNTHFHNDHIQGNKNFRGTAIIIAHENVRTQLLKKDKPEAPVTDLLPAVTFTDSISLYFNGEQIKMIHFPNGHTDADAVVYFTNSKVLHLGDMFFFGMFPAAYAEGGGNIRLLIRNRESILLLFPADTKLVPGHGAAATMKDLADCIVMLKETAAAVETGMKNGKTLQQLQAENILAKYDALGTGGAQTTDQYLAMLYKLLSAEKK